MTNRMSKLKKRLYDVEFKDPGTWHFKETNILKENPEITNEPLVVRKAYAQKYIGEYLPAIIKPDELIIGNPNQNSVGWGTVMPIYYTEEEGKIASRYMLNEASVWGHHPPKWDKIVNIGVIGVKEEILNALNSELENENPDEMKISEYKAMLISLDGIIAFARRHAEVALNMAYKCDDEERRKELLEMYRVCSKIPMYKAESFYEATQSFWFTYCMVNSGGEYVPLARADQVLYPFYKKDIEANKLTKEHARDIVASFLVKCNERVIQDTKLAENHYNFGLFSQGSIPDAKKEESSTNQTGGYESRALTWQANEGINSDANYNYGQSGNDWLMNCIVAGVDKDGNDATNDISYFFVDIMNKMELLMPTLAVRVHKNTPDDFVKLVAKVLRYGQGEPMVYNDEVIIPGFLEYGVSLEDARDYSNDGCWETLVPGKSHFSYAHVMNVRCIEWVFNRGVSSHNNKKEGLDTGELSNIKSYEDFYNAYKAQVDYYIDMQCQRRIDNFGLSYMIAPDPLLSSLMDNCIEKGKDIAQDGAKYIFHQILITGLANTVDSLMVIKKMVFENKLITLEKMGEILKNNWEDNDYLLAYAKNKVPKFGNDMEEADQVCTKVLSDFENSVMRWNEKDTGLIFPCGIGTFENYAALGRDIGASPDGRKFGEMLASNYSPVAGVDVSGPTAVLKSVTKPNLLKYYSGAPVDLSINSNDFTGEEGIDRLKSIITSFCKLGGQILTVTSLNVKDLKAAKEDPDKYKGLRVRMGGLSAYFIAMSPVQQENIIKRFDR